MPIHHRGAVTPKNCVSRGAIDHAAVHPDGQPIAREETAEIRRDQRDQARIRRVIQSKTCADGSPKSLRIGYAG